MLFHDAQIHLQFSGNAFDKASVSANGGFYDSANNEITWDKTNTPALESVPAGGSGSIVTSVLCRTISARPPRQSPIRALTCPFRSMDRGHRRAMCRNPCSESVSRSVKVASSVALSAQALYTTGPFINTGPFPPGPKPPRHTRLSGLSAILPPRFPVRSVSATLPENVTWMGTVNPQSENVQYDSGSRTVTWSVGTLAAYLGQNGQQPRQVAFQVGLQPNITDVNNPLNLVNPATLSATDNFTGVTVYGNWGALTTRLSTDPGFQTGDDMVTK